MSERINPFIRFVANTLSLLLLFCVTGTILWLAIYANSVAITVLVIATFLIGPAISQHYSRSFIFWRRPWLFISCELGTIALCIVVAVMAPFFIDGQYPLLYVVPMTLCSIMGYCADSLLNNLDWI